MAGARAGRRAGAHARGERATGDGGAHTGGPTGRGRRSAGVARERLCMAAEPWLAARRSRRGRPCRGADPRPLRGAGRQGDPARRGRRGGGRRREAPRPRPRAGSERATARRRARGRERRRARAPAGPRRLRPRARGRPVLRAGRPQLPSGPALAGPAAPGAPARPAARRGGARAAGRDDHVRRLHDPSPRERGRRRDVGPARRGPRCRVARVPPSAATRVPAHAPPRARDCGVLRRAGCTRRSACALAGVDPDGRDRAVALRGRLHAPGRPGAPPPERRRAGLPFRRWRRPFRRADHDRAGRPSRDRTHDPRIPAA